jgi:hypothetical protein
MFTPFLELKNFPKTMALRDYCHQVMGEFISSELVKSSDPESYLEVVNPLDLSDAWIL